MKKVLSLTAAILAGLLTANAHAELRQKN